MADNGDFLIALRIQVDKASAKDITTVITEIAKNLKPMGVKLFDETAMKQLESLTKQVQSLQSELEKIQKLKDSNAEKDMRTNTQSHKQAMAYLKTQQAEIQKKYGVESKLTTVQNPNTKQITSAIISFNTEIGEAQSKLFSLNEQVKTFASTGEKLKTIKLQPVSDKLVSDLPKATAEMDKLIISTQKVSDTMKNKLGNITIGKQWIKDLAEFKNVQTMLQSFDPSSMKMLSADAYDISQAFKALQTTVSKVKIGEVITADFNKAQASLDKFKASMGGKITGIEMGTNNWATNLSQFDQLKSKFNELQNFKLDANNMNTYIAKVAELNSLYTLTTQEITRVDNMQKEMTANSKFNSELTNKIRDYNAQLDIMVSKNEQVKNNPLFQQIQNDINKLNLTPMTQMSDTTKKIEADMKRLKATIVSTTTSGANGFGRMLAMATGFYGLTSVFMKLRTSMREMVTGLNEIDKSLTDIQIVTGMSSENADKLAISYNTLGKEIGATTREILKGATAWFRQGKSIEQVNDLVTASIIQSKLANMDSAQSTEYLTSTLNGYQLEANKAISVIDKLVAIDNSASTSVSELAEALQMTSNSARMAGVDLDTLLGYVGTVSAVSRKSSSQIGNAFKTIFARYQDIKIGDFLEDGIGVAQIEEVMNKVGITIKKNETEFRDFSDVIDDLSKKWVTLNDVEQSAIAKSLSGVRQRETFVVLMNNMSKAVELTSTSLNSQGLALDRYDIYLQSTEATMNKFKATMESVWLTTLDSNTIQGVIKFGTAILELTDASGGLGTVLVGTTTALIAFKVATLFLNNTNISTGILGMITKLLMYKATVDSTTGSVIALGLASKLLIGGAIVAGVMAIAIGMNYLSKSAERAREKVETVSSELKAIKSNTNIIKNLSDEYEALAKKGSLNADEAERFTQVQNELKEILPTISGYYDNQGNFILTQVENAKELLKIQEELLQIEQYKLRTASIENNKNIVNEHEKKKRLIDDLVRYSELKNKVDSKDLKNITNGEFAEYKQIQNRVGQVMDLSGDIGQKIRDVHGEISVLSQDMAMSIFNIIAPMEEWNDLSDEQENAIRKFISEQDIEQVELYSIALANGTLSTSDFINGMLNVPSVVTDINNVLKKKADANKQSTSENQKEVKSLEDIQKAYADTTSSISTLTKLQKELTDNNALSGSSISEIVENYQDLLPYINNEVKLREKLTEKIDKQKDTQLKAYADMISASGQLQSMVNQEKLTDESYYKNKILTNEDTTTQIYSDVQTLFKKLGVEYELDLKKFKSLQDAKTKVGEDYRKALYGSSGLTYETAKLIQKPNDIIDKYAIDIDLNKTFDKKDKKSKSYLTQGYDDIISEIENKRSSITTEITKTQKAMELAFTTGDLTSYENHKTQLESLYEAELIIIQNATPKLISARDKLASQLSKTGYFKGIVSDLTDVELEKALRTIDSQIANADETQAESLGLTKSKMEELGSAIISMNSSINGYSTDLFDSQIKSAERYLETIQKVTDKEISLADDEIAIIERKQSLLDEDSTAYLYLEQEKYDKLIGKQEAYMTQYNTLLKSKFTAESEEAKEISNLWYDMELERVNMLKDMTQKAISIRQSEYTGLNSYRDKVVEMLTSQHNEEKKLIQNEITALKKKEDAEKKIIDTRKQELSKVKEQYEYEKKIEGIRKSLKNISSELATLSFDNSAEGIAKRIDLENQLTKEQENLKGAQFDESIKRQENMLNQMSDMITANYANQTAQLQAQLEKEVDYKKKADEMIAKDKGTLLAQMIAWNKEYGSGIDADITKIWEGAKNVISEYDIAQQGVLATLNQIATAMLQIENSGKKLSGMNFDGSKLLQSDIKVDPNKINSFMNEKIPLQIPNLNYVNPPTVTNSNNTEIKVDATTQLYVDGNADKSTINIVEKLLQAQVKKLEDALKKYGTSRNVLNAGI